jgi:hypothetical protein
MPDAFDRMAGSVSAGNVPSSRRVNMGELEMGDWVTLTDGRVLEVVERGWGPGMWTFIDVARPIDEDKHLIYLSPMALAREVAGVARKGDRGSP